MGKRTKKILTPHFNINKTYEISDKKTVVEAYIPCNNVTDSEHNRLLSSCGSGELIEHRQFFIIKFKTI